jgi:hypothetical protein
VWRLVFYFVLRFNWGLTSFCVKQVHSGACLPIAF